MPEDNREDYVRKFWLQRCRDGASVPKQLIVDLALDQVFEFRPHTFNSDFNVVTREKPHGPPQAHP